MSRFVFCLSLLMLAACAKPQGYQDVYTATYACEDGTSFFVRFEKEHVLVTLKDGISANLPQQISGSGFIYESAHYRLQGKGRNGIWTARGRAPVNCTADH